MHPKWWLIRAGGVLLIVAGLALILAAIMRQWGPPEPATIAPTLTAEPLVPTRTPTATADDLPAPTARPSPTPRPTDDATSRALPSQSPTSLPAPTSSPSPAPTPPRATSSPSPTSLPPPTPSVTPQPKLSAPAGALLWQGRARWCAGGAAGNLMSFAIAPLRLGWYLDWQAQAELPGGRDVEYARMVRLRDGALVPNASTLAGIARGHPGALWLIGNEPDVKWQDNVAPADYARLYHEAYTALKRADPQAQVAIGGVTQPSPLRLRYLEAVLMEYRQQFGAVMPVDTWNVHNFILREERGSWGVDIPPGIADDRGLLYEISDSTNLTAFAQQIVAFRRWMADHGFRNSPLIVSEYGIPMPADYGFPPETVAAFLTDTFDYFLTAADPALGYPADANRLVQRWCWYSLADTVYPTGNLFDPASASITALGQAWAAYVQRR